MKSRWIRMAVSRWCRYVWPWDCLPSLVPGMLLIRQVTRGIAGTPRTRSWDGESRSGETGSGTGGHGAGRASSGACRPWPPDPEPGWIGVCPAGEPAAGGSSLRPPPVPDIHRRATARAAGAVSGAGGDSPPLADRPQRADLPDPEGVHSCASDLVSRGGEGAGPWQGAARSDSIAPAAGCGGFEDPSAGGRWGDRDLSLWAGRLERAHRPSPIARGPAMQSAEQSVEPGWPDHPRVRRGWSGCCPSTLGRSACHW